jgi:TolA-binding protein
MIRFHLRGLAAIVGVVWLVAYASAQPTADQQAEMLLNVARKAAADANPQLAAEKFREFLTRFASHKDANTARLGLGLALLDLPDRNYQQAFDAFAPAAMNANFPDRPLALYYAGVCRRGLGLNEVAEGIARPNELPQRQQVANAHFTEAARLFGQARDAFEKKPDLEWAARCRCETAEMELRLGKPKEARTTVEPFLKDAGLARSPYRPLGLYYLGFAAYLLNDIPTAGKSLNQLSPFDQPFGPHACFLLGRIHATLGENAEAATAFDTVLATYARQKADTVEALKQPDRFKNDPWEKARLEALVKEPAPDYIAGATFYGACLNYEAGKFSEALPKFQNFAKDFPTSPLKDAATLRAGFCMVQLKLYDDAVKTLQPLSANPVLADQALHWLGKAQLSQALATEVNNPNLRKQRLTAALTSLQEAANKAGQGDADAKARRPEVLLELADAHLHADQPKQAAVIYDLLVAEKLLPAKAEEVLQRAIDAHHLAGDVATSEARVASFRQQFPNSPLLPLVLFRSAENAFITAEQQAKKDGPAGRQAFADAAKQYQEVVTRFPEFERVQRARYGLALCHLALEEWEQAATVLEAIPVPERTNDLAVVNYVLADCLIRTAPAKAEDALQDNMLREKLTTAVGLLNTFIAANPRAIETPDAMLKLAHCHKRLGLQLASGQERNEALQKARASLEQLLREFPQSPLVGSAHLERAKVLVLQGDKGNAINALRQFTTDPLQKSPVAALGLITLATLLREQNQAPAAAETLQQARQKFESQLTTSPAQADWVPLLRYHHGVALVEAGKMPEAKVAFEQAVQAAGEKPIAADATLKLLQCQTDELKKKLAGIEQEKVKPNLPPSQIADIDSRIQATKGQLLVVAKAIEQKADQFKLTLPQSETRARMLYDAAWTYRAAGGDPVPAYTKLIAEFAELSLAVEARLELAELLAEGRQLDEAIKLLKEALEQETTDKPTPPETIERIRLRLGVALFDKKDYTAAQRQFDAVAANDKSSHRGQAVYRLAECLFVRGQFEEAKERLKLFRDNGAFHNVPGVSDRAMLRLGHAYFQLQRWDSARQAFQTTLDRYGTASPWAVDARYGIAQTFQNQGRYDDAVVAYTQVVQMTSDDRAGRARMQIGECRAKQSRWADAAKDFQTVYSTYASIAELKFPAMLEHARVLVEEKKLSEAIKVLERVVTDAPKDSEWTKTATERLEKLKQ